MGIIETKSDSGQPAAVAVIPFAPERVELLRFRLAEALTVPGVAVTTTSEDCRRHLFDFADGLRLMVLKCESEGCRASLDIEAEAGGEVDGSTVVHFCGAIAPDTELWHSIKAETSGLKAFQRVMARSCECMAELVRERFKGFYVGFDEVDRDYRFWFVGVLSGDRQMEEDNGQGAVAN